MEVGIRPLEHVEICILGSVLFILVYSLGIWGVNFMKTDSNIHLLAKEVCCGMNLILQLRASENLKKINLPESLFWFVYQYLQCSYCTTSQFITVFEHKETDYI